MRLVIAEAGLTDSTGAVWAVKLLGPSDSIRGGGAAMQISVETPNDPEHWAYGEDGPTFNLAELAELLTPRAVAQLRVPPSHTVQVPTP